MGCLCIETARRDLPACMRLPLAGAILLIGSICVAWGIGGSYAMVCVSAAWRSARTLSDLVICVYLAILGGLSLWVALMGSRFISHYLVPGFRGAILAMVSSLTWTWLEATIMRGHPSMNPTGDPNGTVAQITLLSIQTAVYVTLLGGSWYALSAYKSLNAVLVFQGTGWEYKSYKEFRTDRRMKEEETITDDSDQDSLQ